MRVKLWFFCVLYQIFITTSLGTLKLPFTDVEAPSLPKTTSSENELPKLSSPISPKLRKALLEYFKVKYLGTSQLSNMEETSSPAIISSSRALPVPDIEKQAVDDSVNIVQKNCGLLPISPYTSDSSHHILVTPNILTEASIPSGNKVTLTTTPIVPSIYERVIPNGIPLPSMTSLPIISLESLKRNIESLGAVSYSPNLYTPSDSKKYCGGYPTSNQLYSVPYPLRYSRVSLPDVRTSSDLMIPINNAENLRSTSPNSFKIINDYPNVYPLTSTQRCYTLNIAPELSALNNENSNSFLTQRVPKVPFLVPTSPNRCLERQQYSYINQHKFGRKIAPMYYQDCYNTAVPLPYLRNCDISYLSPSFNLGNPCYPTMSSYGILRTLPEPIIPKENQCGFKMSDYETSSLSINGNIGNMNNDCLDDTQPTIDIIIDTTIHCDIPDNMADLITGEISQLDLSELTKESSVTIQFKPHENSIDIPSLSLPLNLQFSSNTENIEPPFLCNTVANVSSPAIVNDPPKLPQSRFPVTYINTSPTYALSQSSANAVSALNDVVSSITRNILNSFASCLTTSQAKVTNTVCPIPYTTPPLGLFNINSMKPYVSQHVHTSTFSPFNTYPTTSFLPLEPIFYDNMPSTTTNAYLNNLTASTSGTSPPTKVTLLPPTSLSDYLPSRPCPATLPLPILPSYIDNSSSFTPMPQVSNVKPLSKTVEKLLDMVFLAELLHGEGYID